MWTLGGDQPVIPRVTFIVERWHFHSHTTGSLTPTFVSARPVSLAVRLAYAFALFGLVSVQAEPTFERLRYFLGGDRPSQTAHLTMSPRPDSWAQVRIPMSQGWYPNGHSTNAEALASQCPIYPVHATPKPNIRLQ